MAAFGSSVMATTDPMEESENKAPELVNAATKTAGPAPATDEKITEMTRFVRVEILPVLTTSYVQAFTPDISFYSCLELLYVPGINTSHT